MNLLIDIGNSNLRWTCSGDDVPWEVEVLRHSGGVPLDLLARWEQMAAPERVVVSNVGGGEVAEALARVTRALWGCEPGYLRTRARFGDLRIAYAQPSRLGVDRWLALVATHRAYQGPCVILDAGTAATFDLLLAGGRHLGGLILPGIEMMRKSLLVGTHIPRVESEPTDDLWATDTASAVAAGSLQALVTLAGRLYDRLAQEADAQPRLILTGGDAERLAPCLDLPFELVPDLVLRGMLAAMQPRDGEVN
ncbi:type III pantothenate kinase [Thiocystis violacea]|uniref:type III pantothenate kinase n=1 Tax=Thiocystis violacea TaxID=13725 RepID=UPI0019054D7F|nr:type III pantothenate kinase [Thiocystis violacea]MBK1721686.1 type III pantothenate kinase [Thiocystis violacea]